MVVTRKVRPKKGDSDFVSGAETDGEEILPEVDEPQSDAADDPGEAVEETIENIKAEVAASQSEPEEKKEGKRVIKPSFKVKYANQKLAGMKFC